MSSVGTIKLNKLDSLVLKVVVTRRFRVRMFIAVQLVRLASFVMGGRIEVDSKEKGNE